MQVPWTYILPMGRRRRAMQIVKLMPHVAGKIHRDRLRIFLSILIIAVPGMWLLILSQWFMVLSLIFGWLARRFEIWETAVNGWRLPDPEPDVSEAEIVEYRTRCAEQGLEP